MRFGMRKPSMKRTFRKLTTERAKRSMKKATGAGYGQFGSVKDPKKAGQNFVRQRATFSVYGKK